MKTVKTTETQQQVAQQGKLDYKALLAECKALGLDTKGKAPELDARIDEYHQANTPAVDEKTEKRGRPIDPNSPRQQRLSQKGLVGRGRPADPNSEWNKRQKELEARREAGELKLGRPVDPNSPRQKRLALQGTVKRGRPAFAKTEVIPTTEGVHIVAGGMEIDIKAVVPEESVMQTAE